MEFHLLFIWTFISLLLAASDASLPAEDYWKTVFPNTPFPKALEDVLQQHGVKSESTFLKDGMVFNERTNKKYKSRYNKTYNKTGHSVTIKESMEDGATTNDGVKSESTFLEDGMVFNERTNKKYKSRYNKTYNKTGHPVTINESMEDGVTTNDGVKSESTFLKDGTVFNDRTNKKYKSCYNKTYNKSGHPVTFKESVKDGVTTNDDGMSFNKRRNTKYQSRYNKGYKKMQSPVLAAEESMRGGVVNDDGMSFNKRRNTNYQSRYNKVYKKTQSPVLAAEESMGGGVVNDDDMIFNKRRNTNYQSRYNRVYKKTQSPVLATEESMGGGVVNDDGMSFNKRRNTNYQSPYNRVYKKTQSPVLAAEESMGSGVVNEDNEESKSTSLDDNDMVINSWMNENDDLFDTTIFYLYRDLYPGRRMKILFNNAGSRAGFLPRQMAESIPFSSDNIPKLLEHFSLKTESAEAQIIKDTLEECEYPKMEGEEKYCPTSLESLIDFVVTRLGRNVKVLSTQSGSKQEYTVLTGGKMIGDKVVVCHKEIYPYAVYYCHEIDDTKAYMVPLMAADGTRVKAVTICHEDTSTWSPEHVSFELLKVKPGVPICHFLASDTLVWVQVKDPGQDFITHLSKPIMDQ